MNIVFDTNALISGMLWLGTPHEALRIAYESYRLAQSPETLTELENVLKRQKFQKVLLKQNLSVEMAMEAVLTQCDLFTLTKNPETQVEKVEIDDTDDLMFIRLALDSNSKLLVSGDRHLLDLNVVLGVTILRINEFVDMHLSSSG